MVESPESMICNFRYVNGTALQEEKFNKLKEECGKKYEDVRNSAFSALHLIGMDKGSFQNSNLNFDSLRPSNKELNNQISYMRQIEKECSKICSDKKRIQKLPKSEFARIVKEYACSSKPNFVGSYCSFDVPASISISEEEIKGIASDQRVQERAYKRNYYVSAFDFALSGFKKSISPNRRKSIYTEPKLSSEKDRQQKIENAISEPKSNPIKSDPINFVCKTEKPLIITEKEFGSKSKQGKYGPVKGMGEFGWDLKESDYNIKANRYEGKGCVIASVSDEENDWFNLIKNDYKCTRIDNNHQSKEFISTWKSTGCPSTIPTEKRRMIDELQNRIEKLPNNENGEKSKKYLTEIINDIKKNSASVPLGIDLDIPILSSELKYQSLQPISNVLSSNRVMKLNFNSSEDRVKFLQNVERTSIEKKDYQPQSLRTKVPVYAR